MVTDQQARRLWKLMKSENTLANAAAKAGMDEKTARKYRDLGKLPSEVKAERTWRTRSDPFAEVWDEVRDKLEVNPGLEAKTLFEDLQRRYPGRFADGQLSTMQRRVKNWRALEGPPKEVFSPQEHHPGELCQSDFTDMGDLEVTIQGIPFEHLIYHFVLPYSNWETGTICFSESFESLSEGLQNALWELGGVPAAHCTDRLSTAVHRTDHPEAFTRRYGALLRHYGLRGRKIQAAQPNENGDVEQSHHRFKNALDQALMLRGSRDFNTREEYDAFLRKLFKQLNAGRRERLLEELKVLKRLPQGRLEACKRLRVRVRPGSTIRVANNVYSVNSRLIGEQVNVRLYAEHLEVWYAQRRVERIPRPRGEGKHHINTGTSSTGWCASQGHLKTIGIERICFPPAASEWPTTTLPIDAEMFSKEAILIFTLWKADQLEIIDRIANCTVSYDAELQKEEIYCPERVEYEEVAPEETSIPVQEISEFVKLESDQIKVGERYRLSITGLSNDNCNTVSASIDDVAHQANITLDDLRWATTEMACP